jgi:hypothetical protein
MIGLPLVSEGKVIGVLYVHDDTSHSFNETEVSLLYNVVNLAVIAIKRASSIKELQELNKILENNNSMLSRINDELKTTSPDVVELIGASDGEVWDITKKIIERSLPGREFALYIHNRETQNCDLFAATQGLDGQLLRFWSRDERNSPLDPPTRETYFYCKQLRNSYGGLEGALILSKLKNADMTELQHENTIFYILLPALAQALYMNAFE